MLASKKEKLSKGIKIAKYILIPLLIICICIGGVYLWSWWENLTFETSYYSVYSEKVNEPIRAVVLADMHQKVFGRDNDVLLDSIEQLEPDIILIAGDTLTSGEPDVDYAVDLCSRLQEIAPVYFGMGNHENRVVYGMDLTKEQLDAIGYDVSEEPIDFSSLIKDRSLFNGLGEAGVTVLQNTYETVEVNGTTIAIGGMSTNLDASWPYSGDFLMDFMGDDSPQCKILLSHFPDPPARTISGGNIDLVISGHNHGGIIRLPKVGGLYSDGEGLFPTLDYGMRDLDGTSLIISRGMGGHGIVPRLFNKPELVVVDIS